MDWQLISHYVVAIMVLPVVVVTVRNVVKNSATLFDSELTAKDRSILKQFAIFLLLPLVVLLHELGHTVAAKLLGVDVSAFHWSLFYGQVEISGEPTEAQRFIIALAGNLVQVLVTILALGLAALSRSPAIVALNVYLYLFSGFNCLIFYPLLSLTAWNYDFAIIYGGIERGPAMLVGFGHLILIAFFVWTFLSQRSRLWFARKTRPAWAREYDKVYARVVAEPTAVNLLSQAWQLYFVGLDKSAEEVLDRAETADPELKDVWLLRGYLHQSRGRYKTAILCFEQVTTSASPDKTLMARAWMARGHCLSEELDDSSEHGKKDYTRILNSYKQACGADGSIADPHYYLAVTQIKAGQWREAEAETETCQNYAKRGLHYLDPILATMVRDLAADIRRGQNPKA